MAETNSKVFEIIKTVHKKDEKKYIEVPFIIEKAVEKIEVHYEIINKQPNAVIDLGVRDINEVRGWSGGARDCFMITRESSTPGYIKGDIGLGQWAVLLGAYKVPDEGCQVRITIQLDYPYYRWLKGDFHTHTIHSDGTYTLDEVEKIAKDRDLDFIATTDHNAITQNYAHPYNSEIVFIPGMELTTNYGHSNFLGVQKPIHDFRCLSLEDAKQAIATARKNRAIITLNHPFDDFCGWEFGFDVDYDVVEIWNGPFREVNKKALDWWQEQLVEGKRMPIIGGSDTHKPHEFVQHGVPTTYVWANEKSMEGIFEGMLEGHCFISYFWNGPTMEMKSEEYRMGDIIPQGNTIDIQCSQVQEKDIIRLISNEKIELEYIMGQEESSFEYKCETMDLRFLRVEIWRYFEIVNDYLLAGLSNPIYIK